MTMRPASTLVFIGFLRLTPLVSNPGAPVPKHRNRFAGLTHKPLVRCVHTRPSIPRPATDGDLIRCFPTHRRPRQIDTSRHFCPREGCDYRGWLGLGISVPTGIRTASMASMPRGRCDSYFPEHHGTIFHGKRVRWSSSCACWRACRRLGFGPRAGL